MEKESKKKELTESFSITLQTSSRRFDKKALRWLSKKAYVNEIKDSLKSMFDYYVIQEDVNLMSFRKLGHFIGYFILSITSFIIMPYNMVRSLNQIKKSSCAVCFALATFSFFNSLFFLVIPICGNGYYYYNYTALFDLNCLVPPMVLLSVYILLKMIIFTMKTNQFRWQNVFSFYFMKMANQKFSATQEEKNLYIQVKSDLLIRELDIDEDRFYYDASYAMLSSLTKEQKQRIAKKKVTDSGTIILNLVGDQVLKKLSHPQSGVELLKDILSRTCTQDSKKISYIFQILLILFLIIKVTLPVVLTLIILNTKENKPNIITGYILLGVIAIGHSALTIFICEKLYLKDDLTRTWIQLKALRDMLSLKKQESIKNNEQYDFISFDCFCPISLRTWGKLHEAVLKNSKQDTIFEEKVSTMVLIYMAIGFLIWLFSTFGPLNLMSTDNKSYFLFYLIVDIFFYFIPILNRLYVGAQVNSYYDQLQIKLHNIQKIAKGIRYSDKFLLDIKDTSHIHNPHLRFAIIKLNHIREHVKDDNQLKEKITIDYLKDIICTIDTILYDMNFYKNRYIYKFLGFIESTNSLFQAMVNSLIGLGITAAWNYTNQYLNITW